MQVSWIFVIILLPIKHPTKYLLTLHSNNLDTMEAQYKTDILSRLCYTELVYGRINKKLKLNLSAEEIEVLMVATICSCDSIEKIGKNFYISNNKHNIRITINSYTYRIITADRIL